MGNGPDEWFSYADLTDTFKGHLGGENSTNNR
jgi:hypothetical protein